MHDEMFKHSINVRPSRPVTSRHQRLRQCFPPLLKSRLASLEMKFKSRLDTKKHGVSLFAHLRSAVVISSKRNRLCMSGCQLDWRSSTKPAGHFSLTLSRTPSSTCPMPHAPAF